MELMATKSEAGRSSKPAMTLPVRSAVGVRTLSVLEFAALFPPACVTAIERGGGWLWVVGTAILVATMWQRIFAETRRRAFNPDGIVTAVTCAIILPVSAPLWQVAISVTFGIVIGQEIFGGRGRNFLNPATVALAFFMFSFPGRPLETMMPTVALAVIPGALMLLAGGFISFRIVVAAPAGLLLASLALTAGMPSDAASLAGCLFGLVFLAADPIAAASTNPGRWIYGGLFGVAAALLAGGHAPTMASVLSAALLASIFAPLIDSGVLAIKACQRERRHG